MNTLFFGPKEDNRVSEASQRVVQEEEERLILQKTPPPTKKKKKLRVGRRMGWSDWGRRRIVAGDSPKIGPQVSDC